LRCRRSLFILTVCVHRQSREQVYGTLVLAILNRKRTNKVFGKRSTPRSSSVAHQRLRAITTSSVTVCISSPATSSPTTVERYTSRDPMSLFVLFNLMASVRAMLTLVLLFILLNHATIRAMLILVPIFVFWF
jgi:hypothetical protein